MLACAWALRSFVMGPTAPRALLFGAAFGVAVLAKFSALLVLPASVLVVLGVRAAGAARLRPALLWAVLFVPLAAATLAWAAYGFDACGFGALWEQAQLRRYQNVTGSGYSIYVLGHVSDRGVWYYYLVTTALKEPLPLLALLLLACVRPVRPRQGWYELIFLLVPAAVLVAVASLSIHQLGHRYILPAFLPLFVWISGLASTPVPGTRRVTRALVAIALVLYVADAIRIAPHFLAYTNQLIAPEHAYRYLADSNLDWHQDDASPEVQQVRAEWDIVDLGSPHRWTARPPALLLGATELSGMWVAHGFWGTPFTLRVRERGYEPARHVAYSQFLFPLDSPGIVNDLHDWYLARSWVEAHNLRVRLGATMGVAPRALRALGPPTVVAPGECRAAVRRTATTAGRATTDVVESFAAPPPSPPPDTIAWTGALRTEEPGDWLLRLAPSVRTLALAGAALPLERSEMVPNAPAFAAVRLGPGTHPFVVIQGGGDETPSTVTLNRLDFDAAGYATAVRLDELRSRLCLPPDDARPPPDGTHP
jgi:hypothetical protein